MEEEVKNEEKRRRIIAIGTDANFIGRCWSMKSEAFK